MESNIHSKIVMTFILAFGIIATAGISTTTFVNVLAQEGAITPEGSVNDTMSGQNASQWATNATLAYAQGNDTGMSMDNSTMMNATLAYAQGEGEGDTGGITEGLGNDTAITEGQTDGDGNTGTENNGGGE